MCELQVRDYSTLKMDEAEFSVLSGAFLMLISDEKKQSALESALYVVIASGCRKTVNGCQAMAMAGSHPIRRTFKARAVPLHQMKM